MSIVEMNTGRVQHVTSSLRKEVGDLRVGFDQLVTAERLSQDPILLLGVRNPLTEFLDETARLATIIETYHDLMVNADRLHPTDLQQRRDALSGLIDRLAASLGDGIGAAGTAAEMLAFGEALRAEAESGAATVLAWMQEHGNDGYSDDEFSALADDPTVPDHVRDAISALLDQPVMMANLDRAGWLLGTSSGVTTGAVALFVATQQAARELGDRDVFDSIEGALNGDLDNRLSRDDLRAVLADPNADPQLQRLAELFDDHPKLFDMLDTGTVTSGDDRFDIIGAFDTDGKISFGDVVATAVNMQAFEGRPAAARDFVMGLKSTNDYRDATGNLLEIRWFSDSGVRSLAGEALAAAPTLSSQVDVVARLPESPGGVRNLAITEYYRRLGEEFDAILNSDGAGGVLPLDAQGSTGTTWFMQGAFASAAIRPVLVDDQGYWIVNAGWAARQSMADGNQVLFDSIATAAAAFIEYFPPGTEPTESAVDEFFKFKRRSNGNALFADGDRQLRDGFALLLEALTDSNPVTRQQTTFRSSMLIGVHEQALVDPFVDLALDQGPEDGYRWIGDIVNPSDSIATGQIDPVLGDYAFDADRPLPVRNGHADHVIGYDLTTTLNPTLVTTANIGGTIYDLTGSGNADIDLPDLAGWDDVPDAWELDSQEIDPAVWHEDHGSFRTSTHVKVPSTAGSTTGVPLPGRDDLPGAAASDWKNYADRMWTIANSFQQTHTLPSMNQTLPGHGFSDADLSFLPEED